MLENVINKVNKMRALKRHKNMFVQLFGAPKCMQRQMCAVACIKYEGEQPCSTGHSNVEICVCTPAKYVQVKQHEKKIKYK